MDPIHIGPIIRGGPRESSEGKNCRSNKSDSYRVRECNRISCNCESKTLIE